MPNSQRKNLADIYRPVGPKAVALAQPWSSGGQGQVTQGVDLSLPVAGFRFVLKGRCVVGTSGVATISPEGFLNFISNITIQGTNARQKGNVTLWSIDLATAHGIQSLCSVRRAGFYAINSGSGLTEVTSPTTPYPADNNPTNNTGTYDFIVAVDLPLFPFGSNAMGSHPHWVPAYLMRNEEWKDSVQITWSFPTLTNGAVAGPLGTGAAGTTYVMTAFGSGAGNPTLDIYSLPIIMGLDLKDSVLPGVLSRTTQQVTQSNLTAAGTNVVLQNMQKQPTTRVFVKSGTGTAPPTFATLNDTNLSALGILLGANRNVRNVVDVFAHKGLEYSTYERDPIQGYFMFDFMESGNPDSAYPGQDIGDGATFQLVANVVGTANSQGLIIQEQTLHTPTGPLYTF